MRLTLLALSSVPGLIGCARDVVVLTPIEEKDFELAMHRAWCHAAVHCGSLDHDSEEECVAEFTEYSFAESKWWRAEVCPDAEYDPMQAAACLDQMLKTPEDCAGLGTSPACPTMDWYRDACSELNGVP